MYFRHPDFICFKKGGTKCYAIQGEHRYYHAIFNKGKCAMAHPSDLATALVALDAEVVLVSLNRERRVSLKDLISGPNSLQETILDFDELLTEFHVPRQKSKSYQAFVKERVRHSADFALVSVGICSAGSWRESARISELRWEVWHRFLTFL